MWVQGTQLYIRICICQRLFSVFDVSTSKLFGGDGKSVLSCYDQSLRCDRDTVDAITTNVSTSILKGVRPHTLLGSPEIVFLLERRVRGLEKTRNAFSVDLVQRGNIE